MGNGREWDEVIEDKRGRGKGIGESRRKDGHDFVQDNVSGNSTDNDKDNNVMIFLNWN